MVARTQISLDLEDHRRARARAQQLGISFAEYVRRLIARDLDEPAPATDLAKVFDLGSSGGADVARHKDAYIGDAVAAAQPGER